MMMNSLWLDKKYINMVSSQLPRFHWKSQTLANFRCVICGDSTTNKIKTRAYLYAFKGHGYMVKCHNCNYAAPFGVFLRRVSPALFDEYVMEKFESAGRSRKVEAPVVVDLPAPARIFSYPNVDQLSSPALASDLIPVRDYVLGRSLPHTALARLYATTHAHSWLSPLVGADKAKTVSDGLPYLVIPLRLPDRSWYGAQVRALGHKIYLTFRWGHASLRTFGLDQWDDRKTTYITEGPLDALCAPNALAMCGSDLCGGLARVTEAGYTVTSPVLVWDNEPRATEIKRLVSNAIDAGWPVVIWSNGLPKDLNDMTAQGRNVETLLQTRTFRGLSAHLEYQQWIR